MRALPSLGVLAWLIAACSRPAPVAEVVAPGDASTTPAVDPMSAGAKDDFAKKYSCPDDRVTVKPRSDIDPMQALGSDSELKAATAATPSDDVKNDPGRYAKWQADQGAQRDSNRAMYARNTMLEVTGCGHTQIVACHPHRKGAATYPDWADCTVATRLSGGEAQDSGAVISKLAKGKVNIALGTPGAKVFLVSGSDRRELPALPISLEINLATQWSLVGTKPGYTDYTQRVSFDDGQPQQSYVVTLQRIGANP